MVMLLLGVVAFDMAMAPLNMFAQICDRIRDMAEEERWGEEKIKQKLLELQMSLEVEEITEEEYMAAEAALMERLEEGRRRKRKAEGAEE